MQLSGTSPAFIIENNFCCYPKTELITVNIVLLESVCTRRIGLVPVDVAADPAVCRAP